MYATTKFTLNEFQVMKTRGLGALFQLVVLYKLVINQNSLSKYNQRRREKQG